jgi:hypothetical protein
MEYADVLAPGKWPLVQQSEIRLGHHWLKALTTSP